MRLRSRATAALCASLTSAAALTACAPSEGADTISLYYAPEENMQKVVDRCNEQADGRYEIVYHKLPREADGQREQMVRRLAAQDDEMDILGLDVSWTGEFAEANWVKEWTGQHKAEAERGTLEGPLSTARSEGKLYGAPKNTNVQLLWYRSDLVDEPPETWDEMIDQAQQLKKQGKPHWVSFTGAQYEGLFLHFNTLMESAGGNLLSEDGKTAKVDEGAVRALEVMKKFGNAGVTSPSMNNNMEDEARMEFETGQAAFQVNWPFVYPSMQETTPELAKKVKWTRMPSVEKGTPSKSTIGGYNLSVSEFSKNPEASFDAALCLRSAEAQKFSAINDGVPPAIESVYQDPAMAEEYPMKETILEALKDPGVRPVTPAAQNVSTVMSNMLSPISEIDPEKDADKMRSEVQRALESKGVMP